MKLPNAERAVVSIVKLCDYSLNPQHDAGKHKARVFKAALGLTTDDAEWLREKILSAVKSEEAGARPASPFGVNFTVDILIEREGRKALVRTAWIIEYGTDFPRLTSCYVL
ncbi:MAG TPA: hypothetical protein VE713_08485 [Pyrinomonadaceae bacterium]|jgi:hypothetical protein|nr:hypothetical protein [Pyrinomonadaceae bacterium]